MAHRNAPLSETGRLRLARCIVEDGWPVRRAAERFQVSHTTAARWARRYRQQGVAGMVERPSRPHHSPARTPAHVERRVCKLRVTNRWGPARIAARLGLAPSTVHRVLCRYHCRPLAPLDRASAGQSAARSTPRRASWCMWTPRSRATSLTAAAGAPSDGPRAPSTARPPRPSGATASR
jgi:hypothetical protein